MCQKIRLQSKRNEVYRVVERDKTYIVKQFSDMDNLEKELEILKLLDARGVSVPKVIKIDDLTLYLEDLGDITLLDWYEDLEKNNSNEYTDMIIKLCQWLRFFYLTTYEYFNEYYILSDVNFRNFIIRNNEIYGIDFEQSHKGNIKEDAGKIAAYALMYDPVMTNWKIAFNYKLIEILSKELKINSESIIMELNNELEKINRRRNIETKDIYK